MNVGDRVKVVNYLGDTRGQVGTIIGSAAIYDWRVLFDGGMKIPFNEHELELVNEIEVGDIVLIHDYVGPRWTARWNGHYGLVTYLGPLLATVTITEPGVYATVRLPAENLTKINNKELWK